MTDNRLNNEAILWLVPEKLGVERSLGRDLEKIPPLLLQHASQTTRTARSNTSNTPFESIVDEPNFLQPCVPLSQRHTLTLTTRSKRTMVLNNEPLELASTPTEVAFTSRAAYKLCVSYGYSTTAMHTSVCLLNTRACLKLNQSKMIPQGCVNRTKWNDFSSLRTAPKQPLAFDG